MGLLLFVCLVLVLLFMLLVLCGNVDVTRVDIVRVVFHGDVYDVGVVVSVVIVIFIYCYVTVTVSKNKHHTRHGISNTSNAYQQHHKH